MASWRDLLRALKPGARGVAAWPQLKLPSAKAAIPAPHRVYAIGDVHGRSDLLKRLLQEIEFDIEQREPATIKLVLLGDLIDRGAGSADLMRMMIKFRGDAKLTLLMGNHEAAMADAYRGDIDAMELWLEHGGRATLAGFGIADSDIDETDLLGAIQLMRSAIPRHLVEWIDTLPTSLRIGDYLFVHAGIRPGVPLDQQTDDDLLWIRDRFLDFEGDHGVVVVHGHSIREEGVVIRPNRIGLDTGAYRTGKLAAIGLEGTDRWVLTVQGEEQAA